MAKSIRSKWKRKCRAIKRERYGKKELDRLKKTLEASTDPTSTNKDVEMIENTESVQVQSIEEVTLHETDKSMDAEKSSSNVKNLMNKNGAYPVWLHPRKIKRNKKKVKRIKGKAKKNKQH